ncbi:hypothetical protein T310_8749, partial [Rasamsonia emersonii CBS 393.64]
SVHSWGRRGLYPHTNGCCAAVLHAEADSSGLSHARPAADPPWPPRHSGARSGVPRGKNTRENHRIQRCMFSARIRSGPQALAGLAFLGVQRRISSQACSDATDRVTEAKFGGVTTPPAGTSVVSELPPVFTGLKFQLQDPKLMERQGCAAADQ